MKILVVASLYPKGYNPVLGCFVRDQLLGLQALGTEIAGVISPVPFSPRLLWRNPRWRAYGEEPRRTSDLGGAAVLQPRVPVAPHGLGYPLYGRLHAVAILNAARELLSAGPVDLIHAHMAHPDGTAALALRRAYGRPVVITIHGQDILRSVPQGRLTRRVIAATIRKADRTVLVSQRLKEIVDAEGLAGRFTVVPNGIPPEVKVEDSLVHELESQRPAEARMVLSVSSLIRRKGHEWVMRGLGPRDFYWIVGDGPNRSRLDSLVSSLGLGERVRFFGRVEPSLVPAFFRAADVFALPSTVEAFGIVYLEAMRARVPVIACRGEGEPSLLRHEETAILVPPCDSEAVSRALARLAEEPALCDRLVTNAFETFMSRFTARRQCANLLKMYQDVCVTGLHHSPSRL